MGEIRGDGRACFTSPEFVLQILVAQEFVVQMTLCVTSDLVPGKEKVFLQLLR